MKGLRANRLLAVAASLPLLLLMAGCGGARDTYSPTVEQGEQNVPDFTLTAGPQTPSSVTPGQPATYELTLKSINGFDNAVTLSVPSGLPTNASARVEPATVTPTKDGVKSTLTIETRRLLAVQVVTRQGNTVAPGTYNDIVVSATGGGKTHTTKVSLVVVPGESATGDLTGTIQ